LLLLIVAVSAVSCSTKKNTFTRRAFHNLTSHYNTYWNGNEAYKQGLRELDNQIQTDYTKILPVVDYGTLQQVQSINSHLDRAIEKASKVVQKHSMFFQRKEHVRRVPDSYMLIGKSYFYKQDYYNARQTFEFVAKQYERQPIRFDAQLWQARTAIKLKEFERSVTMLENLQSQVRRQDFPNDLSSEIPLVYAQHYMAQEDYQNAIPFLKKRQNSAGIKTSQRACITYSDKFIRKTKTGLKRAGIMPGSSGKNLIMK
jgi:tetratricopeptide (TPR) repeat protein